jgi:hypothetical protein
MSESIIALLIVLIAFVFIVMKISRSVTGKGMTCGCGSEKACAGCRDLMPDGPGPIKKLSCKGSGY